MKIVTILLSVTFLIFLAYEVVVLHKRTVCRQEAWRSSVTLHTRTLLNVSPVRESVPLMKCRILVARNQKIVSWRRLSAGKHLVSLRLEGKL